MGPKLNADPQRNILNLKDCKDFTKYHTGPGCQQKEYVNANDDLFNRLQYLPRTNQLNFFENSSNFKLHNHFQNNWHLGNQKALFYNMRQFYELKQMDVFNYLPLTFHVQRGLEDREFKNFLTYYKKREQEIARQQDELDQQENPQKRQQIKQFRNIWIVKPGEISNRGNGITVCDELSEIQKLISSQQFHVNGKEKTFIVQQYIDRPFLYNRRKFDIRCYMLMTQHNGIIRGYWYQEGYIRTSCREFTIADCTDIFIHLTNDAIQKNADQYGRFETGNQVSYTQFQRYLQMWYPDCKYNFFNTIYPQMKERAGDSMRATFLQLDPKRQENIFEIFGLDFMIDENFVPWLIEINTNPSLEICCPLLNRLIPNLMENTFRIGLDPLFPPPANWPSIYKHAAPDCLLENNKFQLIFDELQQGEQLRELFKNAPNCLEGIEQLQEEEQAYDSEDEQKLDFKTVDSKIQGGEKSEDEDFE